MQVFVRDNNVDQALKILKKKMQREGVFREMKQRGAYEKPSERRVREKAEAIRRAKKLARKKAQREGLIQQRPTTAAQPGSGVGDKQSFQHGNHLRGFHGARSAADYSIRGHAGQRNVSPDVYGHRRSGLRGESDH